MDLSQTFRREKGAGKGMKKGIWKDTLALVAITLVAALCLATVYQVTKDVIARAEETERMESFHAVFPDATTLDIIDPFLALHPGAEIQRAFEAKDAEGDLIGAVLSVTSHNGYGGDIVLSIGVSTDLSVTGVKVTSMSETSGLGSHCQDEDFLSQFTGKDAEAIGYVKDGNPGEDEIDAITGATTTTKAVLEAVNQGIAFTRAYLGSEGIA